MTDLPEPLTPADCDLRGYDFMPLFGHRLFSSSLYLEGTADEFRAAVRLWWSAWNQVPAGSLPPSDQALATLADYGRDLKGWAKVRDMAMRGFVPCSDGRLYHPMLCEEVVVAFEKRLKNDAKRKADRERLQAWRDGRKKRDTSSGGNGDGNSGEAQHETPPETEVKRVSSQVDSGQRQRQEERTLPTVVTPAEPSPLPRDARTLLWQEGIPIIRRLTGKPDGACRGQLGRWLKDLRDDCPGMLRVLQDAAAADPAEPSSWITAAVTGRSRGQTNTRSKPSNLDWMRDELVQTGVIVEEPFH